MKTVGLLFASIFSVVALQKTFAQGSHWCATDEIHRFKMRHSSVYSVLMQQQNEAWVNYKTSTPQLLDKELKSDASFYEIPVVFHVIHTGQEIGAPENPSDTTIQVMVAFLNAVFAAETSEDFPWMGFPDSSNGGVHIPIRFVLARRTPDCQPTTGIVRENGSSIPYYSESGVVGIVDTDFNSDSAIVTLSPYWDSSHYINVYLVEQIQGAGGYSTGLAQIGAHLVLYSDIDYAATVIAHEFGHYLGLWHTFTGGEDGFTCPVDTNCYIDGDMVCDTDPHYVITNDCPISVNPCTGNSWEPLVYNIMNYSNCFNRFTAGQRERMLFSLANSLGSLLQSQGGIAVDDSLQSDCTGISVVEGIFNKVRVYPNPFTDKLIIEPNAPYQLFDLVGRELNVNNLSALPVGTYILNSEFGTARVVKM